MKISTFRGDLTDISAEKEALVIVLLKLNEMFPGYFHPVNTMLHSKRREAAHNIKV